MRRFFSGRSLEQAVMAAARHFGLEPEELAYRRVEKRHGFLRARRSVVIDVDPDNPRRPAGQPRAEAEPPPASAAGSPGSPPVPPAAEVSAPRAPAPRREREASPRGERAPRARRSAARPDLDEIAAVELAANQLLELAGLDSRARAGDGVERIDVEVAGDDHELLLADNGAGLLAIQHLLPRMLRGLTGGSRFVRVDAGGFHEQRKLRLEQMAKEKAEEVRRTGEAQTLPPLPPDERRIVHLALAGDPEIATESRGRGLFKRLVILAAGPAGDGEPGPYSP